MPPRKQSPGTTSNRTSAAGPSGNSKSKLTGGNSPRRSNGVTGSRSTGSSAPGGGAPKSARGSQNTSRGLNNNIDPDDLANVEAIKELGVKLSQTYRMGLAPGFMEQLWTELSSSTENELQTSMNSEYCLLKPSFIDLLKKLQIEPSKGKLIMTMLEPIKGQEGTRIAGHQVITKTKFFEIVQKPDGGFLSVWNGNYAGKALKSNTNRSNAGSPRGVSKDSNKSNPTLLQNSETPRLVSKNANSRTKSWNPNKSPSAVDRGSKSRNTSPSNLQHSNTAPVNNIGNTTTAATALNNSNLNGQSIAANIVQNTNNTNSIPNNVNVSEQASNLSNTTAAGSMFQPMNLQAPVQYSTVPQGGIGATGNTTGNGVTSSSYQFVQSSTLISDEIQKLADISKSMEQNQQVLMSNYNNVVGDYRGLKEKHGQLANQLKGICDILDFDSQPSQRPTVNDGNPMANNPNLMANATTVTVGANTTNVISNTMMSSTNSQQQQPVGIAKSAPGNMGISSSKVTPRGTVITESGAPVVNPIDPNAPPPAPGSTEELLIKSLDELKELRQAKEDLTNQNNQLKSELELEQSKLLESRMEIKDREVRLDKITGEYQECRMEKERFELQSQELTRCLVKLQEDLALSRREYERRLSDQVAKMGSYQEMQAKCHRLKDILPENIITKSYLDDYS